LATKDLLEAPTQSPAETFSAIPKLGVGLLYNPALPEFLRTDLDCVDYVSIIPDMFWVDRGRTESPRYVPFESWVELLDEIAAQRPIVSHNIGLSIGSSAHLDNAYLEQIARVYEKYRFPWHSDHLSFVQVSSESGQDHNAGLAIPVPYDREVLDMIVERIGAVQNAVPVPFLLENNVYYTEFAEQDMTEPQFLNALTSLSGCGLLMDVHNLYANSRNHKFDPFAFLDQVDLSKVVEVHIAGGNDIAGMYTDSHAGPCPEPVWDLLEYVAGKAEHLCGITFEFHASYYPLLKVPGIRATLERARNIWTRTKQVAARHVA
jgi:uncharacterized protein (UPF0276 family)